MYDTQAINLEAARLKKLNELHNPHSISYIKSHLSGRKRILELGPGTGELALQILKHADKGAHYSALDIDTSKIMKTFQPIDQANIDIQQIDFTDTKALRDFFSAQQPFDFIYCRWLIVHIPLLKREAFLNTVLSALSPGGVFLSEECDNSTVNYKLSEISASQPHPTYYQQANDNWQQISKSLMEKLNIDLRLTGDKLSTLLTSVAKNSTILGKITLEGDYQLTLQNEAEKRIITDGWYSSRAMIEDLVADVGFNTFVEPFIACNKDGTVQADFIRQHIISFCRTS